MGMIGCFLAVDRASAILLRQPGADVPGFINGHDEADEGMDVDKAWQLIHFGLTGAAYEGQGVLAQAVMGGTGIGEDVGYGPARILDAAEVAAVAAALTPIGPVEFTALFTGRDAHGVDLYPLHGRAVTPDDIAYATETYSELRQYYLAAAARGDAMLLYIS